MAEYIQLQMIWPLQLLDQPPTIVLPEGYQLRTYRSGDEHRFYEIMALAGWPGWDDQKLSPWMARIPPECWFMAVHTGSDIIAATAMGLHNHTPRHPFGGEMGWVAADPDDAGKNLGLSVCAAVINRLITAGYRNIHLYTEHWRLAAIKTYLKLGFIPFLYLPEMSARWEDVCNILTWPVEIDKWEKSRESYLADASV